MISVGIDVSKGKSTVCILKPYGEIMCSPFEMLHGEKELNALDDLLNKLDGEIRIVMEATGIYHLPILTFFHEKGYFVSVINPFAMKKYAKDNSIRGAKTDKLDSIMIANYGIANSHFLRPAGPHFPASQGHIKRPVLEIGRAERGLRPANQYRALSQKAMLSQSVR